MTDFIFRYILVLLLAAALLVFAGCASNDDDDSDDDASDDDDSEFTASSITFEPDDAGGAGEIRLELESVDLANNRFLLKVIGDEIPLTYGVAGRLEFDVELCALDQAQPGNALEGNGAVIIARGAGNEKGCVFGVSRSGDYTNSVQITADKIIGTLQFTVSKAGETRIDFDKNLSLCINHDFDAVEVSDWLGGKLTVE